MTIRLANKFDMPFLLKVLREYQQQNDLPVTSLNSFIEVKDEYIGKLFHHILLGGGLALIDEEDNKPNGIFLGICNSNIWDPSVVTLNHLLLWVDPKSRNSNSALKLIRSYNQNAEKMIKENKIKAYTFTKAYHLKKLNFERMGFSKAEETWIKGL